jgi:hypothetical protein
LLALLVFASGGVCGSALTLIFAVRHVQDVIRHPERVPDRVTRHLEWKLDLDENQAEQVRSIVARHYGNIQQIRVGTYPRVQGELDQIRAEIAEVLTDEQRATWFKTFDRLRRRWTPPPPRATTEPPGRSGAE